MEVINIKHILALLNIIVINTLVFLYLLFNITINRQKYKFLKYILQMIDNHNNLF